MMSAAAAPPLPTPAPAFGTSPSSCAQCGSAVSFPLQPHRLVPEDAYLRIRDLEAQVKLLNSKAAAAVDKLADYEDEVRFLRAQQSRSQNGFITPTPDPQMMYNAHAQAQPHPQSRLSSLSSFLPGRRGSPNPNANKDIPPALPPHLQSPAMLHQFPNSSAPHLPIPSHPTQSTTATLHQPPSVPPDLNTLLEAERRARLAAESTLSQTQSEIEDLTAKLFGEANEMVATERRKYAKLEERVAVLEKRDGEKRRRLERLEKAMERIERVRGLVGHSGVGA